MKRTLDNCTLIQKCVRMGIGTPEQYHDINKCFGYVRSDNDDEPCEQCKNCELCTCITKE